MPEAIDADARERALAAHLSGTATHRDVAALLGVTPRALVRLKAEWAWPPSPLRPAGFARSASPRAGNGDLAARLDRLLRRRIGALERTPADLAPAEAERIARALAVHVRTLAALRDLAKGPRPGQGGPGPDPEQDQDDPAAPPRTLAELRDELCRQLERIRLEERAGDGGEPDGADPP